MLHVDTTFSLGYLKPFPKFRFGSSDRAFGTPGAGGSFGFADPDTGIGFAYAMNKAGFHLYNDPRELALRQAVFHDICGGPQSTNTTLMSKTVIRRPVLFRKRSAAMSVDSARLGQGCSHPRLPQLRGKERHVRSRHNQ